MYWNECERTQRCINFGWLLGRLRGRRQGLERHLLVFFHNGRILMAVVPDCRRQYIFTFRFDRAYEARDWRGSLSLAWQFIPNFGRRHVRGRRASINRIKGQPGLLLAASFAIEVGRHRKKLYCIVARGRLVGWYGVARRLRKAACAGYVQFLCEGESDSGLQGWKCLRREKRI